MRKLEQLLAANDHKSYPAYKNLKGRYAFPSYTLSIDHVQGDPFAAPSSLSIVIKPGAHDFPQEYYKEEHRRIMLQDYLLRKFSGELKRYDHRAGGSGKSGTLSVSRPGQEVLERSALVIDPSNGTLTLRFNAGFPAAGRTTLAGELKKMLFEFVPACASGTLFRSRTDKKDLMRWITLADDQALIRKQLVEKGLIAFVADGAILPRKSGVDDRPMKDGVAFESTKEDRVTLDLSNGRTVEGLGIKEGITLIVGGGYHGKSTLLKALERGVYNHIPGDGREYVITRSDAVKLRAEDGRSIKQLDISAFIRNLPNGKDTECFSTEDASGSTSQAACTAEAVLSGAGSLLIDEDTSATNFMVRDSLMHEVISPDEEPIIPFISRMRQLYVNHSVSTILVAGSSGAFFGVADTILQMKEYNPVNITAAAVEAASGYPSDKGTVDELKPFKDTRIPLPNRAVTDSRKVKVRGHGTDSVSLNHESVELRFVEQVIDNEQTALLGAMLRTLEERYFNGVRSLDGCLKGMYDDLVKHGFAAVCGHGTIPGNYAMVRYQELHAMVSRYRGLCLKQ